MRTSTIFITCFTLFCIPLFIGISALPADSEIHWRRHSISEYYNIWFGFPGVSSVSAQDLDGDGDMDLLAAGSGYDEARDREKNYLFELKNENRSGTEWRQTRVRANYPPPIDFDDRPYFVTAADFNKDGAMDILACYSKKYEEYDYYDELRTWRELKTAWWRSGRYSKYTFTWRRHGLGRGLYFPLVKDLNSDGQLDIIGIVPDDANPWHTHHYFIRWISITGE